MFLYADSSIFVGIIVFMIKGTPMKKYIFCLLFILTACQEVIIDEPKSIQTQKVTTDNVIIEFPVDIKAETPFNISVVFKAPVDNISSKLSSISMDMGVIPVQFQKVQNLEKFKAQLFVGACALPEMLWKLDIVWTESGQRKVFSQIIKIKR